MLCHLFIFLYVTVLNKKINLDIIDIDANINFGQYLIKLFDFWVGAVGLWWIKAREFLLPMTLL